jgi:hypothetical protein
MPHVGVSQENAIRLAQTMRPLAMWPQDIRQQIQLELNIRRGINQPNTVRHFTPIHDRQAGCIRHFATHAVGTPAANVGQSAILHSAQKNGRYFTIRYIHHFQTLNQITQSPDYAPAFYPGWQSCTNWVIWLRGFGHR